MIYVVTAVHNRHDITLDFVRMIMNQTYGEVQLLLVDDGSTDGTAEDVMKLLPTAVIIRGNGNLWWGGALHKAVTWLKKNAKDSDMVFISNDDVSYSEDYIEKAVNHLENVKGKLISGLGYSEDMGELKSYPIKWNFVKCMGEEAEDYHYSANCVATRSLFCRVEEVKRIGGFHPFLLPHYLSDYEWTIRAVRKGVGILCFDDLYYTYNEKATGFRNRKKLNIKQLFSKKSNANPIYRISFIVLTTPVYLWPVAIYNQMKRV